MINLELEDFTIKSLDETIHDNYKVVDNVVQPFNINCTKQYYLKWYNEYLRGSFVCIDPKYVFDDPTFVGANGIKITFKIKDK